MTPEIRLKDKELKQKEYQIELQRQIEERNFIRKKEEYKKTKGIEKVPTVVNPYQANDSNNQAATTFQRSMSGRAQVA